MEGYSTPPKSRSFFDAIPSQLRPGEDFDTWVARIADELAAALLVIRFNGVSEYFTSGTLTGFSAIRPSSGAGLRRVGA